MVVEQFWGLIVGGSSRASTHGIKLYRDTHTHTQVHVQPDEKAVRSCGLANDSVSESNTRSGDCAVSVQDVTIGGHWEKGDTGLCIIFATINFEAVSAK